MLEASVSLRGGSTSRAVLLWEVDVDVGVDVDAGPGGGGGGDAAIYWLAIVTCPKCSITHT